MTAPHLHILINHFPIITVVLAELLLIYAMIRKNPLLQRTALLGFVLTALFAVASGITGESAEEVMKGEPGIAKGSIQEHSDAADFAFLGGVIVGSVALAGLVLGVTSERKRKAAGGAPTERLNRNAPPMWSIWVTVILGLWLNTVLFRVGYLGGLIRHPEIESSYKLIAPEEVTPSGAR